MGFNHAAAAREDVEDARRGHPAVGLEAYAAERGWDYRNQELAGHFAGLNPLWKDYVFNSMRGELVPGRFGTLQHELLEVALGSDGDPAVGSWYGRRSVSWNGVRGLLGIDSHPNEPFADPNAMWVPSTSVKLLVPEAATLPRFSIASAAYVTLFEPKLGPNGHGLRLLCDFDVNPAIHEYLDTQLGPVLSGLAPYVRLRVAYGAVGLMVNGYVGDPQRLDHLVAVAGHAAATVVEIARGNWQPGPFMAGLGPFDPSSHPPGYPSFAGKFDSSGVDAVARHAATLGWTVEDPVALHRRFPRLPVPGVSRAVMAGLVPGTTVPVRLSWHTQMPRASSSYLRGAGLFVARDEVPPIRSGGELITATDMYVAVADGIACSWVRGQVAGELRSEEILQRSVETMRLTQLADV